MTGEGVVRVVIGSAGRRVYLVEWFETAFKLLGVTGEVHITEGDAASASFASARHRHLMPPHASPDFESAMLKMIDDIRPSLFFSVNDYELEVLARTGLADKIAERGTIVLGVPTPRHADVHDKLRMYEALVEIGIQTPRTVLLTDIDGVDSVAASSSQLIIKDRYGSGSSGLIRVDSSDLAAATQWLTRVGGSPSPDSLVVQPLIEGVEHGMDVIAALYPGTHVVSVLAREKKRMRSGETDKAITVASPLLDAVGKRLADWTQHLGVIDVDVIVRANGSADVIDINPRFGGGYPFSHLAGANIPALLIAQLLDRRGEALNEFMKQRNGVASSKYEAMVRV